MSDFCAVAWGSHACRFPADHPGAHECSCCECDDHERDHEVEGCVAKPPYYGDATEFYLTR